MPRPLLILLLLFANACSYSELISSSTEEKRRAYRAHRGDWKRPSSPAQFGRERSVQLFQGESVSLTPEKLSVTGNLGMASLLTADGYALTAAHVVTGISKMDTVLRVKTSGRAPVHAQWTTFTIRDKLGHVKLRDQSVQLFSYGSESNLIAFQQVEPAAIRVLHTYPHRDLALVKLPIRTFHWFQPNHHLPATGSVLFASGNGATPFHGPSAGEAIAVKVDPTGLRTIHTSVPVASGDSGGPAFDSSGRLVGIISRVLPSRLVPVPKLDHSSLRMIDPVALHQLIRRDRLAHPNRRSD